MSRSRLPGQRRIDGQTQRFVILLFASREKIFCQATVLENIQLEQLRTSAGRRRVLDGRGAQGRQAVDHAEFLRRSRNGGFTGAVEKFGGTRWRNHHRPFDGLAE